MALVACFSKGAAPTPSQEASREAPAALQPMAAPQSPASAPRATPQEPSTTPTAAVLKEELRSLPDSVLVGTDVVPLADYLGSAAPIPPSGTYLGEQGGALAEGRVVVGPPTSSITREFAEPGTKPQTKRYEGLALRANGVRLSGAELEVIGTRQSLLVLEKHSGVDGIPDSLWIAYERPAAAPTDGE